MIEYLYEWYNIFLEYFEHMNDLNHQVHMLIFVDQLIIPFCTLSLSRQEFFNLTNGSPCMGLHLWNYGGSPKTTGAALLLVHHDDTWLWLSSVTLSPNYLMSSVVKFTC
jgi:hypothetical protein